MTEIKIYKSVFLIFEFRIPKLFGIWNLEFGIY